MLNYRHLYYFWMVAKEGGFARAADRLEMAVQTISAQVRDLEKSLGHQLLKPSGRGVALTEAGQAAFTRAEEIFQLGQYIEEEVREAATARVARLSVGLSDGISKLAAHALLEPVLATPICGWCATRESQTSCSPSWPCISWTWCWPGRLRRASPATPDQRTHRALAAAVVRTGVAGEESSARPLSPITARFAGAAAHTPRAVACHAGRVVSRPGSATTRGG